MKVRSVRRGCRPGSLPTRTDRIGAPAQRTVIDRVGRDRSANAVFSARSADDDHIFVNQWSHREAVACGIIAGLNRPNDSARILVECHELAVELSEEYFSACHSNAAIDVPAATDGRAQ